MIEVPVINNALKGKCHEIFEPQFFHQSTPRRVLIHRIKPFHIWLRIRREIRFGNCQNQAQGDRGSWSSPLIFMISSNYQYVMFTYVFFCCRIPLEELRANNRFHEGLRGVIKDSAVSLRLLNPLQPSHWNRRIRFGSLIETAESASAVSLRLLNRLPQSHWDSQISFRSVIAPAEAKLFWHSFMMKTTYLTKKYDVEVFIRIPRSFQTVFSNFLANSKPYSKRLLPVNQGLRGDSLMGKSEGRKSRDTAHLSKESQI
jgi:hypothetical protein